MKQLFLISIVMISSSVLWSQSWESKPSPINDLMPRLDSTPTKDYSFFVSGHFYGGSSNSTGYPANTILGNVEMMNESNAAMLICLGDLFLDVSNDIPYYEKTLFKDLKIPLHNAVGNHDISGDIYQQHFGNTYYAFRVKNDLHIVLDTELNDGDIKGEQLEFFEDVVNSNLKFNYDNVFIYAHRTIWKDTYEEMDPILRDNTQSMMANNYESEILPLVKELGEVSNVFWFAGSIGGDAPSSFLYHTDEKNNVTYIATAIRALPRDAILKVNSAGKNISFETISLTGQELLSLEEYDVDYWNTTSGAPPFNWRLVPLYFKQMLFHRYFWYAVGYTLFGVGGVWFLRRRKKRKQLQA